METKIKDPRPDLKEDSNLWDILLKIIAVKFGNCEFYWTMQGFRCMGLRILLSSEETYILRPEIDQTGHIGFFPDEYEPLRDKHLRPYIEKIEEVLPLLKRWVVEHSCQSQASPSNQAS
jgi:hypothetical protein